MSTPNEVTLTEPTPPVEEAPDRDTLLAERRTLEHAPYSDLAAMRLRELDDLLATPPVEEAHDPIYVGEPYPAYESRCSCGKTFVAATPGESSARLARHRKGARND